MKIEILYPEIANLYGDLANIEYMRSSIPSCEIIETDLKSRPAFLDEDDIDLVYMGTMSENSQIVAMNHLEPYKDKVKAAIESGVRFLFTGNAVEILAKEIIDLDDSPYEVLPERYDSETKTTRCLGILDITFKREMMHRLNSLYLGTYGDLEVVGFKSLFAYPDDDHEYPWLFDTTKGPSFHGTPKGEGIHYNNFMATSLTGPLMQLNPLFMMKLLGEMGETSIKPPAIDAAMEAYKQRLQEFKREDLNYIL